MAALPEALCGMTWPLIAKPLVRHSGDEPAREIHSVDELVPLLNGRPVLVQARHEGELTAVSGVVYGGKIRAAVAQRSLRLWPTRAGTTCWGVSVEPDPSRVEALAQIVADHEGVFQAQFVGPYLVDVNPRVYGSLPLAVAAGVNLPSDLLRAGGGEAGPLDRRAPRCQVPLGRGRRPSCARCSASPCPFVGRRRAAAATAWRHGAERAAVVRPSTDAAARRLRAEGAVAVVSTAAAAPVGPHAVVVHGRVRVLVTGADSGDLRVVQRQLGPLSAVPDGSAEADVEVRFVSEVTTKGTLVFVGHGEAGYDEESFFVTRTKGQVPTSVRMPLDRVGDGRCVIECEHGIPAVPLLVAVVNITALSYGVLPLHASAVQVAGRTLLATGWSKGGKTESVLALHRRGASYVSDEWSYLTSDESGALAVSGLPEPVRLWAWQLRQMPELTGPAARSTPASQAGGASIEEARGSSGPAGEERPVVPESPARARRLSAGLPAGAARAAVR